VRGGQLAPSDWLSACMVRMKAINGTVKAWIEHDTAPAWQAARALDAAEWSGWQPKPLLSGVPLGVKDVFNTADFPTTMGSELWRDFTPGNDARVVAQAKLAGAVIAGKTVTAEFAVHAPGATINPRDPTRTAGTSSTGSAVAVACGMVPLALGTQTAGSIIRPASYVGVPAYKPSFGLVPRTGVLKTADTLDTIGWFARRVGDLRLMLDALRVRGRDYPVPERGLERYASRRREGGRFRVAIARAPSWDGAAPHVRAALVEYANQLANRQDVELSELDLRDSLGRAHDVHRTLYHKSLAYYFFRERRQAGRLSEIFREIVADGDATAPDQFQAALREHARLRDAFETACAGIDILLTHAVADEAPPLDRPEPPDSCLVWTLCGAPALALPLFHGPNRLPIAAQFVAPRFADYQLLDFVEAICPQPFPIADISPAS